MRFAKLLAHARPPEKLNVSDPGISVFSAETHSLEHGEVHAYRTGLIIEVPEGCYGIFKESQNQALKGITVSGMVTANDVGEVRVSLSNSHREACEIKSGMALAQLLWLPVSPSEHTEAEETDKDELFEDMKTAFEEAKAESVAQKAQKSADKAKKIAEVKKPSDNLNKPIGEKPIGEKPVSDKPI